MSRLDISLGLLAIVATVAVTAIVGFGEQARMDRDAHGWDARKIEVGAELFDEYCAECHGTNAVGGTCPPLDETSGLHGGDVAPGVAWRLEELGWDPASPFEYAYSVVSAGKTMSSRPDRYPGNRLAAETGDREALDMAMPAHGEDYGGPLRPDQLEALAAYIVAFRDAVPDDPDEALALAREHREEVGSSLREPPTPSSTPPPTPTRGAGEGEPTAAP